MQIRDFYDQRTATLSYVVWDEGTRDALIIDPVLDYDPIGSKIWEESVERIATFIREHDLRVHLILETHVHADHLSGSQALKKRFPAATIAISDRITEVQETFKPVF